MAVSRNHWSASNSRIFQPWNEVSLAPEIFIVLKKRKKKRFVSLTRIQSHFQSPSRPCSHQCRAVIQVSRQIECKQRALRNHDAAVTGISRNGGCVLGQLSYSPALTSYLWMVDKRGRCFSFFKQNLAYIFIWLALWRFLPPFFHVNH